MHLKRLAAAGAAGGAMVLGAAAPAFATGGPVGSVSPGTIKPGGSFVATLMNCNGQSASVTSDLQAIPQTLTKVTGKKGVWKGTVTTLAIRGKRGPHKVMFKCDTHPVATPAIVRVAPGGGSAPKPPQPFPANVNPTHFYGGDTLTFTATCRTKPTLTDLDGLIPSENPFTKVSGNHWQAKEVVTKNLVHGKRYRVKITCGRKSITFRTTGSTKPKPTSTAHPTGVPSGAPQTGDGSSNSGGDTGLIAAGAGVVLAGVAGGGFLAARRRRATGSA